MRKVVCLGVALAALAAAAPAHGAYTFVSKFGPRDPGFVAGMQPGDMAIAPSGTVYVIDRVSERPEVLGFDPSGVMVRKFGGFAHFGGGPDGLTTDSAGNVFVGDPADCRVEKFSAAGQFVAQWGSCGAGDGQFGTGSGITEVAFAPNGHLYVSDATNSRIQEFTTSGAFVRKWGSPGSGPGQFNNPYGVAVDSVGNVYVADLSNDRIQKFDGQGNYLTEWPAPSSSLPYDISAGPGDMLYVALSSNQLRVFDTSGNLVGGWGTPGTGDGQFNGLTAIAVSATNVYTTDYGVSGGRVQIFDLSGNFQSKWGDYGNTGDGQFRLPWGIDTGPNGDVYVGDWSSNRVQRFDRTGAFISKWGTGTGDTSPGMEGVAVAPSGDVYVADANIGRLEHFDASGSFVGSWPVSPSVLGVATDDAGNVYTTSGNGPGGNRVRKWTASGTLLAEWSAGLLIPNGLDVDAAGNIYVADTFKHRVVKLDPSGTVVGTFGGLGVGDGQFFFPYDVAVNLSGEVFVADSRNNRIQKLSSNGAFLEKWGSLGVGDGQFDDPRGVAVDDTGDVLVTDQRNYRVQRFRDTTGYPRPKAATPQYSALVLAYQPCGSPNMVHAAPLSYSSCTPPTLTSGTLTAGTPESNARLANMVASLKTIVSPGDPSTPADEADVQYTASIKDVRRASDLADYTGTLEARIPLRITDRLNSPYPAGRTAATTQGFDFSFAVPCAATGDPSDTTIGAACALTTTADSIAPGAVVEGARAIWEYGPVRVYDGGPDEDAATVGDNTLFLHQGIVIP
jgi:streptogramin lyase